MDIEGLGASNVERFYKASLINDIADIYELDYLAIEKMDGFGAKSVSKLKDAIEASKQRSASRLLFALGVQYIGETTAKLLCKKVLCLEDLAKWDEASLTSLNDIGPKLASSINDYFSKEENINLLKKLRSLGLSLDCQNKEDPKGEWDGLSFLFTGTLTTLNRNRAKELVEQRGGSVLSAVSKKLNYLIVGQKAGSKLKKAQALDTIKILTEEEFINLLGL